MKDTITVASIIIGIVIVITIVGVYTNHNREYTGSYSVYPTSIYSAPVFGVEEPVYNLRNQPGALFECYDTDGRNVFVMGEVTIGNRVWIDYCENEVQVVENFCMYGVRNSPQRGFVLNECLGGCVEGACQKVTS